MTVEDVARRAGVHPSTVSRALNPATRHRITEEVVARVVAIAAELGYVPNGSAAALRTRRSKMIGVVLPDITNPVFPPILVGIEAALDEEQYVAVVANAGGTPEHARLVVERLLARQVDGLVLATASRSDGVIELCLSRHVPVVLVNRSDGGHRVSSVVSDELARHVAGGRSSQPRWGTGASATSPALRMSRPAGSGSMVSRPRCWQPDSKPRTARSLSLRHLRGPRAAKPPARCSIRARRSRQWSPRTT